MPSIKSFTPETSTLRTLRKNWVFLLVRVQSEPLAADLVADLVAFGTQWDTGEKKATSLSDALLQAKATAIFAGHTLDRLIDKASAAIHEGKKPDLSLPLHQLYFDTSAPSDVKKHTLGTRIDMLRSWPSLLAKATQPALLALAPAATTGLAAAIAAEDKVTEAQAALDKFELDGELHTLFTAYNKLADTTLSGLKAIAHAHPELHLSLAWAESFFLHEVRSKGPTTVAQATVQVKKLEAELAEAQERLAALDKKQKTKEAAEAAVAQAKIAVTTAKKEAAAAKQKEREAVRAAKRAKRYAS